METDTGYLIFALRYTLCGSLTQLTTGPHEPMTSQGQRDIRRRRGAVASANSRKSIAPAIPSLFRVPGSSTAPQTNTEYFHFLTQILDYKKSQLFHYTCNKAQLQNLYEGVLRSNTKDYGGKTHQTDSQNNDTTAPSSRELYRLQFSLQVASPETFGYTLVWRTITTDNALKSYCHSGQNSFIFLFSIYKS
jgi:hypothetical protein